jgi:hypothetical protein
MIEEWGRNGGINIFQRPPRLSQRYPTIRPSIHVLIAEYLEKDNPLWPRSSSDVVSKSKSIAAQFHAVADELRNRGEPLYHINGVSASRMDGRGRQTIVAIAVNPDYRTVTSIGGEFLSRIGDQDRRRVEKYAQDVVTSTSIHITTKHSDRIESYSATIEERLQSVPIETVLTAREISFNDKGLPSEVRRRKYLTKPLSRAVKNAQKSGGFGTSLGSKLLDALKGSDREKV